MAGLLEPEDGGISTPWCESLVRVQARAESQWGGTGERRCIGCAACARQDRQGAVG